MSLVQKAQAVVEAIQQAPTPVNLTVMIGSYALSLLQPIAIIVTIVWGGLQIHGYVMREFGRDFLWLTRVFSRKGKK